MAIYFLDSSAIAKRYVAEIGSAWIADLMHSSRGHQFHLVRISGVEVVAAIAKRVRAGNIQIEAGTAAIAQFRTDFEKSARVVEIFAPLVQCAMDLAERHVLRGYDAVQLAAAMTVNDRSKELGLEMILTSADDDLNAAAAAEGLAVENPNFHP